jgi:hypothetical protein
MREMDAYYTLTIGVTRAAVDLVHEQVRQKIECRARDRGMS